MADPDITVAVCTRNGAGRIESLLGSLALMNLPERLNWELLVVDNGSTDGTPALLAGWRDRLPLRIRHEPRPGLSHARNMAAASALGRYICWTDDDAVVSRSWLAAYHAGFLRYPEAALFGGRISPRAAEPQAGWFAAGMNRWPLSSVVAARDLAASDHPLHPRADAVPWGTNFAVRREEQQRFRYDPALDYGEETDLMGRLLASGECGWWLGDCEVEHVVPPERQDRAYVASYFRRAGRAAAYLRQRNAEGGEAGLAGADGWTGRRSADLVAAKALSMVLARAAWLAGRKGAALRALARENYLEGVLDFRRA